MNRWEKKYRELEQPYLEILKRFYGLETERVRLQHALAQCTNPDVSREHVPPSQPLHLRRHQAGEPLFEDETKWKARYDEIKKSKERYENTSKETEKTIEGLRKELEECLARQQIVHAVGDPSPLPKPETEPSPAKIPQQRGSARRAGRRRRGNALQAELDKATRENKKLKRAQHQLKTENTRLENEVARLKREKERLATELKAEKKEHEAARAKADFLATRYQAIQQHVASLQSLTALLSQGQRNFLDLVNDPVLDNSLTGLISYSLTELALALGTEQEQHARAMRANLYVITRALRSYRGHEIPSFKLALESLEMQGAREDAEALVTSSSRPGPSAKPFQVRLKTLRDIARVDLRPFFYVEDDGSLQRLV